MNSAVTDPQALFASLRSGTEGAIGSIFPIVGQKHRLELDGFRLGTDPSMRDVQSQLQAKLDEQTWGAPLMARLVLRDSQTGKVKDRREVPVAMIPKMTATRGFIVDGKEYYVDYLWKTKPGIYVEQKARGVVASIPHPSRRNEISFDPAKREFKFHVGTTSVPIQPVLTALGISQAQMAKAWGPEIAKANEVTAARARTAFTKLQRALGRPVMDNPDQLREILSEVELDPEVTRKTLGQSFRKLTPDAMFLAATKALHIARGNAKPDDRDNLRFKELIGLDDQVTDRVSSYAGYKTRSFKSAVDRHDSIENIVRPYTFHYPIHEFFNRSSLSQLIDQTSPIDMLRASTRSSIAGEGMSMHALEHGETRTLNPSHMAFLDPIDTPEGSRTGVNLQLALGVMKDGRLPKTLVYDPRKKKYTYITPTEFDDSIVALPDQYRKKGKALVPIGKQVKAAAPNNDLVKVSPSKVDYVIPNPGLLLGLGTALVPFAGNTSPGRLEMAARHMSQAISLVSREEPLVQVAVAEDDTKHSYESALAREHLPVAPVSGKVTSVSDDMIRIKDNSGRLHEVPLYRHYPLMGKREVLDEKPTVKAGQKVTTGQVLGDNNYTRNGTMALGTNLFTALVPMPGRTFEDALVVSDGAAMKLTSEHMYKFHASPVEVDLAEPKKFQAYYPSAYDRTQLAKIDKGGVVKPGTEVKPGDPLILALREQTLTNEAMAMKKMHRVLAKPYLDASTTWDSDYPGKVVRVHRTPEGVVKVHVAVQEPLEVGDKLTTRHGVKGVVVDIRPDPEMPKTKGGRTIELAINPHGVAARMAAGQIYEMASAKIAEKRGKPILVPNFLPETDYGETTREALDKLGIPDQDEIVDPTTGKTIGKALTGPSYVLKQRHQVDRKMAARAAGPGFSYDVNRQPKGGGETGGQSLGGLGNMALLAHGARALLKESHTYKVDADQADEMWRAVQTGALIPPPRLTFAHRKFQDYVRALGVNMEKKGSRVKLIPMTDKEVVDSTRGELKRPGLMFRASDMAPEEGGLFDPFVTGGIQGEHAARITLADKLPNPFLERGVMSLTGLKQQELRDIIAGKSGIVSGVVVERKTPGAVTGSKAIEKMLSGIDPKKEMKELKEQLPGLNGAELDKASRRYRYLKALLDAGFTDPADAYMTKHLYVPPPSMRPVQVLASGAIIRDSINELYKGVGIMNERLKDAPAEAPESRKGRTRLALYDAVGAAMGAFEGGKSVQGAEMHGALDVLTGVGSPKYSWFQSKLLKGRQDLSARSTIVPNPDLTIDEIGIPRPIANAIYRPFIVRELNRLGYAPLEAQELIRQNDPSARTALERVMQDRPLLMKRDPVLHKYGVMAFRPRIVGGRAIHIPPLITASMGADFDGDAVSLYASITNKAVGDAKRMFPSENLLNPSTGRPVFTPSNEMNVGLYRLSLFGKDTGREYKTVEEAAKAVAADKLDLTDVVTIAGKKTTVGRLLVHRALPEPARDDRLVSDPNYTLTSKRVDELLSNTAKKDPGAYSEAAQKLMNLGNAAIFDNLFSVSIKDFKPDKETRRKYFEAADREVARILASKDPEREQKAIARWASVGQEMMAEHTKKPGAQANNLWVMSQAGVKPSPIQYQQITMAPVLMTDAKGNPILAPVDRSYSEGMDTAGFWLTSLGARTALIKKGIEVREPGYLNKQMVATVGNQVVVSDALPKEGIAMDVDHPDVVDRYLVEPVKAAKFNLKRGTLLTPEIVDRLKNSRVSKVVVASPLTSPHGEGISAKAYGLMPNGQLPELGENIGVMAGQSIGERLAQLMLKATHLGGVYEAGAGSSAVNQIRRIKELLRIPREIPNPAVLAPVDGKVRSIKQDPAGGWDVTLADSRGRESDHYVPGIRKLQVDVGQDVKKGRPITDGDVDLHELLDVGGVDQVRKQIVNELDGIFRPLGIRRRNIEVLAKGVTNTAVVEDPGDAHDLVRGQYVNLSAIRELNATRLKGKKPVKVTPVLSGISSAPLDNTEDWLNKMNHERLRESMVDAALEGHVSDISGYNPYSAMAFNERFGEGISKKPGAY